MSAITYTAKRELIGAHTVDYIYNLEYGFGMIQPIDDPKGFESIALAGNKTTTSYRLEKRWRVTTVPLTDTTEGSNLITNGTFAADSDWAKGTGWTIAAGVAHHSTGSASNLSQAAVAIPTGYVSVNFFTDNVTAGNVTPVITGLSSFDAVSTDSNNEQFLQVAAGASLAFYFAASSGFVGDLDTVDVRLAAGQFHYMQEFLRSIMYGETCTFDPYGTIAAPIGAVTCELVRGSVKYARVHPVARTSQPAWQVSFELREAVT